MFGINLAVYNKTRQNDAQKLHVVGRAAGQKKMQSQLERALDVSEAAMCVLL